MKKYFGFVNRLRKDEEGATAIEYGLLAALIAVAIITAVTTLGTNVAATFDEVSGELVVGGGGGGGGGDGAGAGDGAGGGAE